MSIWVEQAIEAKICEALRDITIVNEDGHHFGRPYMTAYQLAIKLHRAHPEVAEALGVDVGGNGVGSRNSLAQYLARELSRRIKGAGGNHPIEGAFLSNDHVRSLTYDGPEGEALTSSLTGTGFDVSLFRLRAFKANSPS
jgi:hypothetical protein